MEKEPWNDFLREYGFILHSRQLSLSEILKGFYHYINDEKLKCGNAIKLWENIEEEQPC
jgi:hypothetical protein